MSVCSSGAGNGNSHVRPSGRQRGTLSNHVFCVLSLNPNSNFPLEIFELWAHNLCSRNALPYVAKWYRHAEPALVCQSERKAWMELRSTPELV